MCLRFSARPEFRLFFPFWVAFLALGAFFGPALAQERGGKPPVVVLEVSLTTAISPVQADMLDTALERAAAARADLLLLRLDTPGGSIEVMRRMVMSMLGAQVPIAVWVAPSGARAGSAGVFLAAAGRYLAMAPQTTIGSASPVGTGGTDIKGTLNAKIKNDLESLLRSLAVRHGRNADWYVRSVSKAANIEAMEAARLGVADMIAVDRDDLLDQIGKRGLPSPGGRRFFTAADARVTAFDPGLRHGLLSWLLDPQVAYILLLIGFGGLFFELITPGAILPGVVGSLCLLLALYALSVLPTNATGLLLLLLGGVFFALEIPITSYGLLSLAGVASLFLGSVLLFRGDGLGGLPLSLILPTVIGVSVLLGLLGWLVAKSQRQRARSGPDALVGQTAVVRSWQADHGKVFVRGELWNATSRRPLDLRPQQPVAIVAVADMTLEIEAVSDTPRNP